jgi:hypothetical protein
MSKHPAKLARRARQAVDVLPASANRFASFRYASAEISLRGGKAHVKARRAQWEDGKFSAETFEGEADQTIYERAAEQAQRYFVAQSALLFQSLGVFLPFSGKPPRDRD